MVKKLMMSGLVCAGSVTVWADMNMHEGLWEITTKMEMVGIPMQMPVTKHTQCITKEKMVPQKENDKNNCKMLKQEIEGDTVKWVLECSGKNKMKAEGKSTYHGDTFEGIITIKVKDPQSGEMKIINHVTGKYIGACK